MADVNPATAASAARAHERREIREALLAAGGFAARCTLLATLLIGGDERVLPIRLGRLLRMAKGIGDRRVGELLRDAEMHPAREMRRVGELTESERYRLARGLERR